MSSIFRTAGPNSTVSCSLLNCVIRIAYEVQEKYDTWQLPCSPAGSRILAEFCPGVLDHGEWLADHFPWTQCSMYGSSATPQERCFSSSGWWWFWVTAASSTSR